MCPTYSYQISLRLAIVNNNSQVHFQIQKFNSDKNNQLALSAATYIDLNLMNNFQDLPAFNVDYHCNIFLYLIKLIFVKQHFTSSYINRLN